MKSNEYLYGVEEVPDIPREIIVRRIELLEDNLEELLKVDYRERNGKRVRDIRNAIMFWETINER